MALVKCPECSKELSSKATTCPHCGCKITVCPECNTVFSDSIKTCTVCGFDIQKGTKSTDKIIEDNLNSFTQDGQTTFDIMELWEGRSQEAKKYSKILSVINWIATTLCISLIVAIIIKLLTWDAKIDFLQADNMRNLVFTIINIIYSIVVICMIIEIVISQIKKYNCSKWIKDNGYDFSSYFKLTEEEKEKMKFSDKSKIEDIGNMAYYATNPKKLIPSYISVAFATIIAFVGTLFLRAFAVNWAEYIIINKIYRDNGFPQTAELSYTNLILCIVFGVVALIAMVMWAMFEDKKREEWIKSLDNK